MNNKRMNSEQLAMTVNFQLFFHDSRLLAICYDSRFYFRIQNTNNFATTIVSFRKN